MGEFLFYRAMGTFRVCLRLVVEISELITSCLSFPQFNLETLGCDQFRSELTAFKSLSTLPSIPPLHINVLFSIPSNTTTQASGPHHGMNVNKVLVHHFPAPDTNTTSNARITRITPSPRYILLETHTLSFAGMGMMDSPLIELPQAYK